MEGVVVDAMNRPRANARVVLVPDDERRNFPDQYGVAESESDGRFDIHGIPPGDYTLFAWEYLEPNAYLNAAALAPYESMGAPVRIAPSTGYSVRLNVISED